MKQRERKVKQQILPTIIFTLFMFVLFNSCGQKKTEWKGTVEVENGVTVVLNPKEPMYMEDGNLVLKEINIIDLERDDLAELGISEITGFDVDSGGNIYLVSYRSTDSFIFKFDENTSFIDSFCNKGQGPGELEVFINLRINTKDEILLTNSGRDRLIVLNTSGDLITEVPIASNHVLTTLLENNKILAMETIRRPGEGIFFPIVLCNSDLESSIQLRPGQKLQNYIAAKELNGIKLALDYSQWSISDGHIYIGNQDNGYEFLVYDFDGKLTGKIRKEYVPVKVTQDIKEKVYARFEGPDLAEWDIQDKVFFPDSMPPFQYFFVDDVGRLYVMTFEKGDGEEDFIFDIYNPEGFYICRTVLDNSQNLLGGPPFQGLPAPWGGPYDVKVRNNILYCMRGKDSGYQELVLYKMIWQ